MNKKLWIGLLLLSVLSVSSCQRQKGRGSMKGLRLREDFQRMRMRTGGIRRLFCLTEAGSRSIPGKRQRFFGKPDRTREVPGRIRLWHQETVRSQKRMKQQENRAG